MDFEESDRIIRHLDAVIEHLDGTTAELRAMNQRFDEKLGFYDDLLARSQRNEDHILQLLAKQDVRITDNETRIAQNEATMARLTALEEQILALLRQVLRPPGNGAPPAEEAQP